MGHGVAGIGQNTIGLPYRPFLDWTGKSGNFPGLSRISRIVHLGWVCYLFSFNPKIFQIFK
jgi:hypothetical protein